MAELRAGLLLADNADRRHVRERFQQMVIERFDVLPFAEAEATVWADLYAELRRRGQLIGERDLLIAATAVANGHSVMTRNVREFERVPGLTVVPLPAT